MTKRNVIVVSCELEKTSKKQKMETILSSIDSLEAIIKCAKKFPAYFGFLMSMHNSYEK